MWYDASMQVKKMTKLKKGEDLFNIATKQENIKWEGLFSEQQYTASAVSLDINVWL